MYALVSLTEYEQQKASQLYGSLEKKRYGILKPPPFMYDKLDKCLQKGMPIKPAALKVLLTDLYGLQDKRALRDPWWEKSDEPFYLTLFEQREKIVAPDDVDSYEMGRLIRTRNDLWPTLGLLPRKPAPIGHNQSAIVLLAPLSQRYLGHVYVWPDEHLPETMTMIGIRSSLENLACREYDHIAWRILQSVLAHCRRLGFRFLMVQEPLENMLTLLSQFHSYRTLEAFTIEAWPGVTNRNPIFAVDKLEAELNTLLPISTITPSPESCPSYSHGIIEQWKALPHDADIRKILMDSEPECSKRVFKQKIFGRNRTVIREEIVPLHSLLTNPQERLRLAEKFLIAKVLRNPYKWYTPAPHEFCYFLNNHEILKRGIT